jgi:protein-S-isoprenylcysteine O-methyltransferase Ste14
MAWRWPGPRGEAFVVLQFILLGLIFFGPPQVGRSLLEPWPPLLMTAATWLSPCLLAWGLFAALYGTRSLGSNLTPFPRPKAQNQLVQRGAYALVRHPIYSGLLSLGLARALWVHGSAPLLWTALLFWLFDRKARREEAWLLEAHPDYADYQRRVKRLLPWLY